MAAGSFKYSVQRAGTMTSKARWGRFAWMVLAAAVVGCGSVENSPTGSSSPSSFGQTGQLNVPRRGHSATLLLDGNVLLAGGTHGTSGSAADRITTGEIYVPSTGRFRVTGSLPEGRADHVAALLQDGRVLLAGGGVAEIALYDPQTSGWSHLEAWTPKKH